MTNPQLDRLAQAQFGLTVAGPVRSMAAGNINRSFVVPTTDGDVVFQELNRSVFPDVDAVMGNVIKIIDRVETHNLAAPRLLRTVDDAPLAADPENLSSVWRCYWFIEGAATPPIKTPEEAQSVARSFGRYAKAIDGLDLAEHMPGYHDFDERVRHLDKAISQDVYERLADCEPAIETLHSVIDRLRLSGAYEAWQAAPRRNAHNDAKGPNCIVDPMGTRTIIDLDTTMPGTILADIGELVRSSTRDLRNPSSQELMAQIEAVNRGFVAGYGEGLLDTERMAMLLAGPLLAAENAVRFLADHIDGDPYYGAATPGQNLERAQVQTLLASRLIDAIEWATVG